MIDIIIQALKIVVFISILCVCHFMSYFFSPYNPDRKTAKYITIKNPTLAKLLIAKGRKQNKKYIKVSDKNKISLYSLIFYIAEAIILIISFILQIIPTIPCKPFDFYFTRHGACFSIDALNQKIPLIFSSLLLLIQLLYITVSFFISNLKKKEKTKISNITLTIIVIATFVLLIIHLLIHLFEF